MAYCRYITGSGADGTVQAVKTPILDQLQPVCGGLAILEGEKGPCPAYGGGSVFAAQQHHVAIWVGHAGQDATGFLVFGAEAGPFDFVMHAARFKAAHASAAGAVAAAAGPIHTTFFQRLQQWRVGPGVYLDVFVIDLGVVQLGGDGHGVQCARDGRVESCLVIKSIAAYPRQIYASGQYALKLFLLKLRAM